MTRSHCYRRVESLSGKGMTCVGMGPILHILMITDQSIVIPIVFTSKSPESLFDCLYFDFLLEESDVICSLHRLQRPTLLFFEVCYFMFDLPVVTYVSISKRVPIFYLPQLSASFIAA